MPPSRSRQAAIALSVSLLASAPGPALGGAAPLDGTQQGCVNGMNKAFAAAIAGANRAALQCLKDVAKETASDLVACLAETDLSADVARLEKRKANKCDARGVDPASTFAYSGSAEGVAEAAKQQTFYAHRGLLGPSAPVAPAEDAEPARCQKGMLKGLAQVIDSVARTGNSRKKQSLRGKDGTPATTAADLEADLQTVPASPKVVGALAALEDRATSQCTGLDLVALFPGTCAGSGSPAALGSCAGQLGLCRYCLALNQADALSLDCAAFSGLATCPPGVCGNGALEDVEACDDGNLEGGDGCRADCTEEICGDGVLDPGEECDSGENTDEDGCLDDCSIAQEAPPDDTPNAPLVVPLGGAAETFDAVSNPFGDRIDVVEYSVTGLAANPDVSGGRANLLIHATCAGTGIAEVEFRTGGQAFGCGDTVVSREVTAASNGDTILIEAVQGDGTFVEWTLSGTATVIPPPLPEAPPDTEPHVLNAVVNGASSVTEFVSFPGGDTQDQVNYDVPLLTGTNRVRLVIAISCFGSGTNQIAFETEGQTFACGQTIVDRAATDATSAGTILIEAQGTSFVQWVLTATTTPLAPIAPPDSGHSLTIPLDTSASVTDFVSFPDGDRIDGVNFSVSGMNPNPSLSGGRARLILALSCFGTGTQFVELVIGAQTFSCGQTVLDREITADSDTGRVTVRAVGGTGTFVQWVLTGAATRSN